MSAFRNFRNLYRYFSLAYLIISLEMSTPTTSVKLFLRAGRRISTRTSPEPQPTSRRLRSISSDFLSRRCENSLIICWASRFCKGFALLYNLALFILRIFYCTNFKFQHLEKSLQKHLTGSQIELNWTFVLISECFKYKFNNKSQRNILRKSPTIDLFSVKNCLNLQLEQQKKIFS